MEYHLTEHARDALSRRQIEVAWMEHTFVAPDWVEQDAIDPELEHRLARIPEFGGRVLRVVVNASVSLPRIVTAFFDRKEVTH